MGQNLHASMKSFHRQSRKYYYALYCDSIMLLILSTCLMMPGSVVLEFSNTTKYMLCCYVVMAVGGILPPLPMSML